MNYAQRYATSGCLRRNAYQAWLRVNGSGSAGGIGVGRTIWFGVGLAAALAIATVALAETAPLVAGDEPVVATQHKITTPRGALAYEALAGRLGKGSATRESGEVRGHIFFTAYVVKQPPGAKPRPLTFAWNGGPTGAGGSGADGATGGASVGGSRAAHFVDNAESLLYTSDLVFMDPVETGFSRPEKPDFDKEFLSTLGDFAATAEFVRAWRARFAAEHQPLFLFGESYGTWRVNGTTEILEKHGIKVAMASDPALRWGARLAYAVRVPGHAYYIRRARPRPSITSAWPPI